MSRILPPLLFVFLMFSSVHAAAATSDAQAQFKAGIEAFNAGNLEQARALLDSAAGMGLNTRSLAYNLGVVYFQLAQYDKAENAFRTLLSTSQKALAYYNIGLTKLARGDQSAAADAFESALAANPKDKLAKLAKGRLRKLRPDDTAKAAGASDWQGLVSLASGYETNVALFPDSAAETIDSSFVESIAAASGYLYRQDSSGVNATVKAYTRQYPSAHDFDLHVAQAETGYTRSTGQTLWNVGMGGDYIWRDRRTREKRARLFVGLKSTGCPGESAVCSIKAEAMQVFPEQDFDAYRGQRYRLDTRYRTSSGDWSGDIRYRGEYNDRDNLETDNEFFSLSPERHGLRASLTYSLTPQVSLEAKTGFRYSYYRDPHQLQVREGVKSIHRIDRRVLISLAGAYDWSDNITLKLSLDHSENHSNIDRYSYDRQTATVGLLISF